MPPPQLISMLVRDDEILIAGPLLRRSPQIDEPTLLDIAKAKSQPHLLAVSDRPTLGPRLTDVIIRRGDREVIRRVASGMMNKVIADDLGVAMRTVEVHRARALAKLGVRSAAEAAALLVQLGPEAWPAEREG